MTDLIYRGVRHTKQSRPRQAPVSRRLIYRGVSHDGLLRAAAWSPAGGVDMCYRGVRYRSPDVAAASQASEARPAASVVNWGLAFEAG